LTSSGNSSAKANATANPDPHSSTRRSAFALTGPSTKLDPRVHAVRGDLADIRLADRVFAPHYAVAMPCVVTRDAVLAAAPGGERLAALDAGDAFELLELAGDHGWGIASAQGLVGYCDRTALELA
jgi:hypothetical protein